MTVFVNISLAVCNSAYILNLAVFYCECELSNCCVALGSSSFFKTVLTVLQALEFCIVALELSLCDSAESSAAIYLNAFKSLTFFFNLKHEGSLAC